MPQQNLIASFIRFGTLTSDTGENIHRDKAYLFNYLALK